MNWTLQRTRKSVFGIFGMLICENPVVPSLVTLEHSFPQDGDVKCFSPAVPAGTYVCERRRSPEFGYDVFLLLDVPGHDWVEIHIGNFNADSKACILLGELAASNMILRSRPAFEAFMNAQVGIDRFNLTVKDPA